MRKLRYLILLLVPALLSCEKQDTNGKDAPPTDEKDKLDLYDNSYFPLDTNDIWIYSDRVCTYDDVMDSIDDSYCETRLDTIIPSPIKLIGRIFAKKFGYNYFNTQFNKVSLIIDTNREIKDQYSIDILFTDKNDTNWSDTVIHASYGECIINFIQKRTLNDTTISLEIKPGYIIGLHDSYVFQKNRGIISSSYNGINQDGTVNLEEYKNNQHLISE
jgi:hypothetical protein